MWNMQSGIRRKTFDVGLRPPEIAERFGASERERAVSGLATDLLNRLAIASTYDGTINVSIPRQNESHDVYLHVI